MKLKINKKIQSYAVILISLTVIVGMSTVGKQSSDNGPIQSFCKGNNCTFDKTVDSYVLNDTMDVQVHMVQFDKEELVLQSNFIKDKKEDVSFVRMFQKGKQEFVVFDNQGISEVIVYIDSKVSSISYDSIALDPVYVSVKLNDETKTLSRIQIKIANSGSFDVSKIVYESSK